MNNLEKKYSNDQLFNLVRKRGFNIISEKESYNFL